MSMPPIDRNPPPRAPSAEPPVHATARVAPVVPVDVPSRAPVRSEAGASMVNLVGQRPKPEFGEGVYSTVSDPARRGSEANTVSRDWTVQRPAPEKVEDPPPVPISKVLLEHLHTLWEASASAVQVQQQVRSQVEGNNPALNPMGHAQPANQPVPAAYTPSRVRKNEKI